MTLSQVIYQPSGKDAVVHNTRLPDKYSVKEDLVGPNEFIVRDGNSQPACRALLEDDVSKINEVYQWISNKDTFLSRSNQKPEKRGERSVGLGVGSSGAFIIVACGSFGYGPALGVIMRRTN